MIKGIVVGILGTLAALALAGYCFVLLGLMPANADAPPYWLEKWAARASLHATLRRDAPRGPNPLAFNDENALRGARLYAQNCAVCHGAADAKPSATAHGLYQRPPQLAHHGVEDDPEGAIFWFIYHGVRLTGMPSYRESLSEQDLWALTLFLKHMDALPPRAEKAWKAIPSQAAAISGTKG